MKIDFSLIVATLGRKDDLERLFESLCLQSIPKSAFEVIVVDQNTDGLIDKLIELYQNKLDLIHLRSPKKGLSYNRNLGISKARGTYLAVPDDDCVYYPDTLESVEREIKRLEQPGMIVGRVFNRAEKTHVFKKTPDESFRVTSGNFYKIVSSIALFFRNDGSRFNEDFGIGEKYHSNEDGELMLNFITSGKNVFYSPAIECSHAPYDSENMPSDKLYRYGIGFGALCRKYLSMQTVYLFIKVIVYQILRLLGGLLTFNGEEVSRRTSALKGRVAGFFIFRPGLIQ